MHQLSDMAEQVFRRGWPMQVLAAVVFIVSITTTAPSDDGFVSVMVFLISSITIPTGVALEESGDRSRYREFERPDVVAWLATTIISFTAIALVVTRIRRGYGPNWEPWAPVVAVCLSQLVFVTWSLTQYKIKNKKALADINEAQTRANELVTTELPRSALNASAGEMTPKENPRESDQQS